MNDPHTKLALDYFDYLARHFPVMCASDEFYFLPRAERARQYYDRLDNFDKSLIEDHLSTLKQFQNKIDRLVSGEDDFEKLADLELLKANIAGILIELEMKQSWRYNPLLYLKIAFIGLDHALTKPVPEPEERTERVRARLEAIPRLLKQAAENIESVPETYWRAAVSMVNDCNSYLAEINESIAEMGGGDLGERLQKTRSALNGFDNVLRTFSPVPDQRFATPAIETTLRDHFLSPRSLFEIFTIAVEEWDENIKQLKKLQAKIDPGKSWIELYDAYSLSDSEKKDTISLYQREIDRLASFFREHGFREIDSGSSLKLCETPSYLRSIRNSASFSAAFDTDAGEEDLFYITTFLPHQKDGGSGDLAKKRLNREYKFLTAHETVPGHHLLDSVRRGLKNPVRRQIESPLFYEGWAYYAESLLTEYGYVDDPIDCLIDCKRRLWRAARCQIDVGLATGMLDREGALKLLTTAGFSMEEASAQVDRFQLNPGYQLCYTLGRFEIMKLKETYGITTGRDEFHRLLLEGGELPFHLIEKRFQSLDPGYKEGES
jgi:hypothetical protein